MPQTAACIQDAGSKNRMSPYSRKPSAECIDGQHSAFEENGQDRQYHSARDILNLLDKELAAKLAAALYSSPLIREDLVNRVKMEILAGLYETPERLEGTIDRLMKEFHNNWI